METFKNRTFLSMDGDKIKASLNERTLHISIHSTIMHVELSDVQIDKWYEKGNIRVKLVPDGLLVSVGKDGFPRIIKYFRVN